MRGQKGIKFHENELLSCELELGGIIRYKIEMKNSIFTLKSEILNSIQAFLLGTFTRLDLDLQPYIKSKTRAQSAVRVRHLSRSKRFNS